MASKQKQGYVIARSKSRAEYYTSTAAYDRPEWVVLNEATVYSTPELAQQAVKKLWLNGSFASSVKSLTELMDIELEMPPAKDAAPEEEKPEMIAVSQTEEQPDGEMQGVCPECECDPCECDDAARMDVSPTDEIPTDKLAGEPEMELEPKPGLEQEEHSRFSKGQIVRWKGRPGQKFAVSVPDAQGNLVGIYDDSSDRVKMVPASELSAEDEEDTLLGQHLKAAAGMESEETARLHPEELKMLGKKRPDMKEQLVKPTRMPPLKEETKAQLPARPGNDPAKPEENDTTAATLKDPKAKQIDFKDPVGEEDKPQTDLTYAVAQEHDEKVVVPAEIKSQLKAVIDDFAKAAKDNDTRDDTKGSFAMTAGAALQQLLDDLSLGTVAGIKQAQIHMTSYMNPITSHIPEDVVKFIARGGRKSSLKDLFDVKWEKIRGAK